MLSNSFKFSSSIIPGPGYSILTNWIFIEQTNKTNIFSLMICKYSEIQREMETLSGYCYDLKWGLWNKSNVCLLLGSLLLLDWNLMCLYSYSIYQNHKKPDTGIQICISIYIEILHKFYKNNIFSEWCSQWPALVGHIYLW